MARPQLSFLLPRPQPLRMATPAALKALGRPDISLIATIGIDACLRWQILPWCKVGGGVMVFAETPAALARAADALAPLGQCFYAPATPEAIRTVFETELAAPLRDLAEEKTPYPFSVRSLQTTGIFPLLCLLFGTCAALILAPLASLAAGLGLMTCLLICTTGFRLMALLASRTPAALPDHGEPSIQWPMITILVPLLREGPMVGTLIKRLADLDYPAARYDLCLIVEEDDQQTRNSLAKLTLPQHAQVICVPRGRLRTKPRALNYALPFTRGMIIGIYDAEDRPARDQLKQVARHFARAHPKVVCLQGQLDYYNARSNWLARCFTLEYCAWFRVILPGLARLGLPVPLGGTTLFLRRHAIEELGGWDAHNVTEDADLGIRIARFGYRTEIIATVTEEEANARPWPWIKQRSRWFKGYALTWAVHMKSPRSLLRDLGLRGFLGVQLTLLGALMTFLGAPILWLFGITSLLGQELLPALPPWLFMALGLIYLASWLVDLATQVLGVRRAGKDHLIAWAPTTYGYFPLATIAAWRALVQALRDPFTWEKTEHGIFQDAPRADPPKPAPAARPVSSG